MDRDKCAKVLASLVRADAELFGEDKAGNYHIIIGIILLCSESHGSRDGLVNDIYTMIADGFVHPDYESESESESE